MKEQFKGKFKYKTIALENHDWSVSLNGLFDEAYEFIKQGIIIYIYLS